MINKIIDSICSAINAEFGDAVEIFTDSVEQGLKNPCFFVFCLEPTINLDFGRRYARTNKFCIQYLSDEGLTPKHDVMERLFNILEMLDVNGKLFRGTDIKAEYVDGVLNFTLNYDMFVYAEQFEEFMETLGHNSTAKVV